MGLFSVHNTLKELGGFVEVDSAPGQGTTIRLYFPRDDSAGSDDTPLSSADSARDSTATAATVLLVEDQDTVRAAIRQQIEALGYDAIGVEDAAQALETLRSDDEIGLVLSDIILTGGMNGRELAKRIKHQWPTIPVVLITGYTAEFAHGAEADPKNGFTILSKPFRIRDLQIALEKALEKDAAR